MSNWVKFHDELRRGAKRGLTRSARFIFLELCIETRPGKGVIALPIGMSDLDAIHDMLGGNKREIAEALPTLTAGTEPMIAVADGPDGRSLTVPSWNRWNAVDLSTARVTKHRKASRESDPDETVETREVKRMKHVSPVSPSDDVKRMKHVSTVSGETNETLPEERRVEKSRSERERDAHARGPDLVQLDPEEQATLNLLKQHPPIAALADEGANLTEMAKVLAGQLSCRTPEDAARRRPQLATGIRDAAGELGARRAAGTIDPPAAALGLVRRYVTAELRKVPAPVQHEMPLPPGIRPVGSVDATAKPPPPKRWQAGSAE